MNFDDLLAEYKAKLSYASRMMKTDGQIYFYWQGYKQACFQWLRAMKYYCDLDLKLIKIKDNNKYIGYFEYRGKKYYISMDDYGQSYILHYDNKTEYASGAYNFRYLEDFSDYIDAKLFELEIVEE